MRSCTLASEGERTQGTASLSVNVMLHPWFRETQGTAGLCAPQSSNPSAFLGSEPLIAEGAASAETETLTATEAGAGRRQKQLRLKIGATVIPHPDKVIEYISLNWPKCSALQILCPPYFLLSCFSLSRLMCIAPPKQADSAPQSKDTFGSACCGGRRQALVSQAWACAIRATSCHVLLARRRLRGCRHGRGRAKKMHVGC